MFKCYCICLFIIYFNVGFCIRPRINRVTTAKYPFNAMVYALDMNENKPLNQGGLGCSGVIISNEFILTACSCLYFPKETKAANMVSVILYYYNIVYQLIYNEMYGDSPVKFVDGIQFLMVPVDTLKVYVGTDQPMRSNPLAVTGVHEHPQYQHEMPYYDLAFLQLKSKMILTRFITPIKLAIDEKYYYVNNSGLLTGYGQTEENQTMLSRHLHSVRSNIAPPESCDKESDKDSIQRNVMRWIYSGNKNNARRIFCARVRGDDEGMCQGWHIGSAFTVGKGEDRRLVGIASTPNICPNSGAVIITSLQGMSDWYTEVFRKLDVQFDSVSRYY